MENVTPEDLTRITNTTTQQTPKSTGIQIFYPVVQLQVQYYQKSWLRTGDPVTFHDDSSQES